MAWGHTPGSVATIVVIRPTCRGATTRCYSGVVHVRVELERTVLAEFSLKHTVNKVRIWDPGVDLDASGSQNDIDPYN